jgi:cytochrome c biogenesis protein CcmG, thiol:disulfide interchange protein DsbE
MRGALLVLALMTIVLIMPAASAFAAVEVGQPAPALIVQELDGHSFDLTAQRGKVVIVNFWATWCPPCRAEMPMIDDFYRRYHSQGLELIGVSADSPHDRSEVVKVIQSLSYPMAMLDDAKTNGFGSPDELPVTYVIDRIGLVRAEFTPDGGPISAAALETSVVPLLGHPAGPKRTDAPLKPPSN